MNTIKINSIELSNWKAHTCRFSFGNVNTIMGMNGAGKTLIYKAWCWLLTGKSDPLTSANHELFDNRTAVTKDTPKASVKAEIDINGYTTTLERTAESKWVRKLGTGEYEKAASDEYHFFIDDIEVPATQFKKHIDVNLAPIDLLPYCINGEFFTILADEDKDKAQKLLASITGEVADSDFPEKFAKLLRELKTLTTTQLLQRNSTKKRAISNTMTAIPTLIDAKEKELAELNSTDWGAIEAELKSKEKLYNDLDGQIRDYTQQAIATKEIINESLDRVCAKERELRMYVDDYNNSVKDMLVEWELSLKNAKIENENRRVRNEAQENNINKLKAQKASLEKRLETYTKKREELLTKRDDIKGWAFDESSVVCPACGRPFDDMDKIEAARRDFNIRKQQALDAVIAEGKNVRDIINDCTADITSIDYQVTVGFKAEPMIDLSYIEKQIEDTKSKVVPIEQTDGYKRLQNEIKDAKAAVPHAEEKSTSELVMERNAVYDDIAALNRRLGRKDRIAEIEKEIADYQKQLKENGFALAQIEGEDALIKEYEQLKAAIISHRVNDCLTYSRIATEKKLKNGETVPACEITDVNGVKYSTLNGAARVLTQVDMQVLFCDRCQIRMPIFIDECNIFDSSHRPAFRDAQMFYIFASDNDLTVTNSEY